MSGVVRNDKQVQFRDQDEGCHFCCCWLWAGPKKTKPTTATDDSVRVGATERDLLIKEGERPTNYADVEDRRDTELPSQTPPSDEGYATPVTRSPGSVNGTPGRDKDAERAKRYWSQHASNANEDDAF